MRVVIYGLGAVGGVVAAALVEAGTDVIGIARGRMLDAITKGGLCLRTPSGASDVTCPVVSHPRDITFRPDDLILLTMKTQDTAPALTALREAGVYAQAIFCFQNGVSNEDLALRLFPNVHGVTVMMPATYVTPGEVVAYGAPMLGLFDIGRYPSGTDADDHALANLLNSARMRGYPCDDVMASKRGKLLLNVGNALEAALGRGAETGRLGQEARAEAQAVFRAAGLAWQDVGSQDPRRKALMQVSDVDGVERTGGSTAQSLQRGTGSVETDWLNGEIARLGRLHTTPTPVNAFLCQMSQQLVRDAAQPGETSLAQLEERFGTWQAECGIGRRDTV